MDGEVGAVPALDLVVHRRPQALENGEDGGLGLRRGKKPLGITATSPAPPGRHLRIVCTGGPDGPQMSRRRAGRTCYGPRNIDARDTWCHAHRSRPPSPSSETIRRKGSRRHGVAQICRRTNLNVLFAPFCSLARDPSVRFFLGPPPAASDTNPPFHEAFPGPVGHGPGHWNRRVSSSPGDGFPTPCERRRTNIGKPGRNGQSPSDSVSWHRLPPAGPPTPARPSPGR